MRTLLLLSVLAVLSLPVIGQARAEASGFTVNWPLESLEIREIRIAQGPRVVLARLPIKDVAGRAFVAVYSPYGTDQERIPGLAHYAEHLYSNTASGLDDASMPEEVESYYSNAMTRPDYVSVWNTVNSAAAVAQLLNRAGPMWRGAPDPDRRQEQADRVRAELERSRKSQLYAARRAVDHAIYGNRPPFAQELAALEGFTDAMLDRYLAIAYAPENAVLVIAGDIDLDTVQARLQSILPAESSSSVIENDSREVIFSPPTVRPPAAVVVRGLPDFEGIAVDAAFPAPPRNSRDHLVMLVLDQLLLGGRQEFEQLWKVRRDLDSVLGARLAEAGVGYLGDARGYGAASPPLAEADPSQFHIVIHAEDRSMDDLVDNLEESLAEVYALDLTEARLARAKAELINFYGKWLTHDSLRPLGDHLAGMLLHDAAGPERLRGLDEEIRSVRLKEVRRVMQRYLLEGQRYLGVARHDPEDHHEDP